MKTAALAALLLMSTQAANAGLHCVDTSAEFTQALATATGNAEPDVIRIESGTYSAPAGGWNYTPWPSDTSQNLTISGGWDDGCGTQLIDSNLTKLSGANARRILAISRGQSNDGTLTINGMSFINAFSSSDDENYNVGLALRIYSFNHAGPIYVEHLIVRDSSSVFGRDVVHINHKGTLYFRNNLVVNNQAGSGGFGVEVVSSGTAYVSHNTIAKNTILGGWGVRLGLDMYDGGGARYVTNNVIWGNTGGDEPSDVEGTPLMLMIDNDIGVLDGLPAAGSHSNFSIDPQFVSASDFRLMPQSPLHDIGNNNAFGGIVGYDLNGFSRVIDGVTDLGAYETQGSNLFKNSFE